MLRPYRSILQVPGALAFSAAGLLARTEMAMVGLGTVLLLQRTTGSYAIAGAVAATTGLASAVASPAVARLADRHGQAPVVRSIVLVHVAGLVGLVVLALVGAPLPLLFLDGAVTGAAMLSVGSLVRTRWAGLLGGTAELQVAFAFESVLDELVFIVGPIAVTLLATLVHPAVGLLLAAATALAGSLLLAAQRGTDPGRREVPTAPEHGESRSVLRMRGIVVVAVVFLAAGGVFGTAEVIVAAFAKEAGVPPAAGLVLALWATGSLLAGLAYGAVRWRSRLERRFLVTVLLFAAVTVPMAVVTTVPALAAVFLVAGFAISPVVVTGTALTERLVPASRLTEGLAWTNTALSLTYALGAAAAGAVVDAAGAHTAFLVPVACGLVGLVAVLVGLPRLAPVTAPPVDAAPSPA